LSRCCEGDVGFRGCEGFRLSVVDKLRYRLRRRSCIFRLEGVKSLKSIHIVFIDSDFIEVCGDCLQKALEKGLVSAHRIDSLKNKDFYRVVKDLHRFAVLIEYYEVFDFLSRLDESSRDFLYEVYGRRVSGQHSFDYVCVDVNGDKYLVDVTSVSFDERPAGLSKKEKQVADKAREKGFKILIPIVKFLNNWVVRTELTED